MPNHKSAEKRMRQGENRRLRNQIQKSKIRNSVKAVRDALDTGDAAAAGAALPAAVSRLYRAAAKGAIPQARANRLVSRLNKAVNRGSN
jgi:small subunit ribosomal protein S20